MELKLRPWNISDLESLVKYANNWNIAKNLTDKFPYPYTESSGRSFIEFATKNQIDHIFAIEVNGEAVGGVGVHPQDDIHCKNAELGYWLAEPFWNKGISSLAVKEAVDFAFNNIEIDRVYAKIFGTNLSSQRVLEKNGFVLEGRFEKVIFKNNEYFDELIYAQRRENWKKNTTNR
ncbi:MAG: N-acetyltransferase [Flavobacteriaceae bacterium]|nr:MAG: N-acetyltransferase [Flavobacteriaceae bacterium]